MTLRFLASLRELFHMPVKILQMYIESMEIPPFQGAPLKLLAHGDELILRYTGSDAAGGYYLDIIVSERGYKSSNRYTQNPMSGHFEREAEQGSTH